MLYNRSMKSKQQTKILENEFLKKRNWNKEKIEYLSNILGLSQNQIYKWNWDRKFHDKILKKNTYLLPKKTNGPLFKVIKIRERANIFAIEKDRDYQ